MRPAGAATRPQLHNGHFPGRSQRVCTYFCCLLWCTTRFLHYILSGKKAQHKDPFEESDANLAIGGFECRLNLNTPRPIPPNSQFREIAWPGRDIPSWFPIAIRDSRRPGRSRADEFQDQLDPRRAQYNGGCFVRNSRKVCSFESHLP